MSENNFDLTIVGSGPGGYVAAIRAGQLGRVNQFLSVSQILFCRAVFLGLDKILTNFGNDKNPLVRNNFLFISFKILHKRLKTTTCYPSE